MYSGCIRLLNEQMKRFKILGIKYIKVDDSKRITVFNALLNKEIVLPYPEFCTDCILIIANPIDLSLSEEGIILGKYSLRENARTCYFLKPYSEEDYRCWNSMLQDEDDWIPFFPEQKRIVFVEDGTFISFYKDISFNKHWQPISHALYVRRVHEEHQDELDYMDVEVNKYVEIGLEEYEFNCSDDNYDTYATEFFGDIEGNDCQDECWECAKLLQKEMLFVIHFTTQKEVNRQEHIREVLGWDIKDALYLVFEEDGRIDFSEVTSYRVYHNNELIMHEGSWIKL